ncbi:MAG: septal ring lytic transglycosylase RlpA family protein [Thioalkalispiraceae bacterium]|jgi:rare lipoprotein A
MRFSCSVHHLLAIGIIATLLTSCSTSRYSQSHDSPPDRDIDVSHIPNPVPRLEPRSKYGNPDSYVVNGQRYYVMDNSDNFNQRGIASWYGKKFHGHRTSSGETYDMYKLTAAHKSLPLPTYVEVRNLRNQRSVVVRVNDRGPFHHNRIIDLSYAAAKKLGITAQGTGMVEIRALNPNQPTRSRNQSAERGYLHAPTGRKTINRPYLELEAGTETRTVASNNPEQAYRLFLQVGAFVSRNNAEQLRSKLLSEIGALNINTGYNEEKNIYRVRIGPLASVEQADQLANRISNLGFNPPHIVID